MKQLIDAALLVRVQALKSKGVTYTRIAEQAGYHQTTVGMFVNGKIDFPYDRVEKAVTELEALNDQR